MKKTALLIMILTILSKLLGLGRELTLSYFYGASHISDAYLISIVIPGVIFGFISAGLSAGYIPIYSQILNNEGESIANRFTSNLINISLLLSLIVVIFSFIFSNQIVKIFASGFEGESLKLAVDFTRITLFAILFTGIVSIFTGFLQINGNYMIPALIGFPLNFFIILSIALSLKINTKVMALGYVVAVAFQVLLMILFIKKNRFKYTFSIDLKDKYMKKMLYIALPIILGVSVNQINMLVDRTIASTIVVGGISALNYAERLNGFVQGIFVISISTALYPLISKMAAENNIKGLKIALSESITGINLLVLPATIGSMIFAVPIVSILFGRGAFDNNAVILTSSALFFYSIGMVGFGLREILSRAFYSLQDTKTPMINAAIGMLLNIVLNIILSSYMGIAGLALATSIAAIFTTGLMFVSLRNKIGPFGIKHIAISFLKILFASLSMGGISKLSYYYMTSTLNQSLSLIFAVLIGAISYCILINFMKIEDVDLIIGLIRKRFVKKAS